MEGTCKSVDVEAEYEENTAVANTKTKGAGAEATEGGESSSTRDKNRRDTELGIATHECYERIGATKDNHGIFSCKYCKSRVSGSHKRKLEHFLGADPGQYKHSRLCRKVPADVKSNLEKLVQEEEKLAGKKKAPSILTLLTETSAKDVHQAAASLFYSANIPFAVGGNENWVKLFEAVRRLPKHIPATMPGREALGGSLLVEAYDRSQAVVNSSIAVDVATYGCTLCSDGLSAAHNLPYFNCMQVSLGRELLLDCTHITEKKTKEFVADYVAKFIRQVGEDNVVLVVMDGPGTHSFPLLRPLFPRMFFI
eukprot:GHVU01165775.1.p3 GENE.GHVU01165775.1~~GHVU01165775.1.p3  ORF type:complete len:310 (+),score=44.21 GHVU01165775.1:270-1199(+)